MNILCTGATGIVGFNFIKEAAQLGHKVFAVGNTNKLPEIKNVTNMYVDLTQEDAVQRLVLDIFPDVIVNCAAIASPDDVDNNPELAEKINVQLAERLAQLSHHVNARFLHISTDMVFDGSAAPYKNTDVPMPSTLYGTTKLLAEKKILKICAPTCVVLRISHVSGNSLTTKRSLHEKLLRDWADGKISKLRTNEIKCPVSVSRLSTLLCELCQRQNVSGIYHFAGEEPISRYEIGVRIAKHFGLNPEEFIEPSLGKNDVNLTLDMTCIAARVKTRSCMFEELLSDMQTPTDLEPWLKSKSTKLPVKRFKL